MTTLEQLIAKCNAAGLRVNNLFQHERTLTWQANLWEIGGNAHDFGHGPTAIEALQRAFDVVSKQVVAPPVDDGSDLC